MINTMITKLLLGVLLYKDALDNVPITLKGIIGGILMIIVAFWLIWVNDNNDKEH